MADNINIKDSSNAVVPVATEDIGGGVEVQRVKLMLGAHGQDGGDVTGPNPLPVEVQNTTDTDNPVWGNQGPLTQDAREQSNYDSVNPLLTRDTYLGRVLGQDLLVNPSTKRLQVEGAPVADNSVFGFLPALNTDLTVVLNGATTLLLQLTGTWAGTVSFEASPDSQNWYAVYGQRPDVVTTMVVNTTVVGVWVFSVGGFRAFRARFSAYTSGVVKAMAATSVNGRFATTVTVNGTVGVTGFTVRTTGSELLTSDSGVVQLQNALVEPTPWNPRWASYVYGDAVTWNGQVYQCIVPTSGVSPPPYPNNATYWQVDQRQNKSLVTSSYVSPPAAARLRVEIDLDAYQYRLAESLLAAKQQQEVSDLLFQERQLFLMEQGVSGLYGSNLLWARAGCPLTPSKNSDKERGTCSQRFAQVKRSCQTEPSLRPAPPAWAASLWETGRGATTNRPRGGTSSRSS